MRVSLWRLAATCSPQHDQVDTLRLRQVAHDVAGLTFKLPRLDFRPALTRQLLRFGECLPTLLELSFRKCALAIGRQSVTTGPARSHLQARSVRRAANEKEEYLGVAELDLAFYRLDHAFRIESVDEHEYSHRLQPIFCLMFAQRKLAATSTAAAIKVTGATTAPIFRKSHAETCTPRRRTITSQSIVERAPTGVRLGPRSAPARAPKRNGAWRPAGTPPASVPEMKTSTAGKLLMRFAATADPISPAVTAVPASPAWLTASATRAGVIPASWTPRTRTKSAAM